jgi:tRNA-splicing ligase RtcB
MAYKGMDEIIKCIADTVEMETILKPVYNFKASE